MNDDDERQTRLAAIRRIHVPETDSDVLDADFGPVIEIGPYCAECGDEWPCDLALLLAEVERLEAERAFFERNAHKATALAVEEYDRENALKSEIARLTDENERLTLERDESVANMTAASAAFARLQRNAEAWNEDSKRLHNEYLPTSRIMDEVLATRDAALMKAWAERDAERHHRINLDVIVRNLTDKAGQLERALETSTRSVDDWREAWEQKQVELVNVEAERDAATARAAMLASELVDRHRSNCSYVRPGVDNEVCDCGLVAALAEQGEAV